MPKDLAMFITPSHSPTMLVLTAEFDQMRLIAPERL
jgi:hypothetical protein